MATQAQAQQPAEKASLSTFQKEAKYYEPAANDFPEFDREEVTSFVEIFELIINDQGVIPRTSYSKMFETLGLPKLSDNDVRIATGTSGSIGWSEFLKLQRFLYPQKKRDFEEKFMKPAIKNFPEFARDELLNFASGFRTFDTDSSGSIDSKELMNLLRFQGEGISEKEAKTLIGTITHESDLTWLNFLQVMRSLYPQTVIEFSKEWYQPAKKDHPWWSRGELNSFIEAFRTYDLDGSGSIDSEELKNVLAAAGEKSTNDYVKQLLKEIDTDNSGVIEWTEYLYLMDRLYPNKKADFEETFYKPAEKWSKVFERGDIDALVEAFQDGDEFGSGSLDFRNLSDTLKNMGQGCAPNQVKVLIEKHDPRRTGIEWPAFLAIMASFYTPGALPAPEPVKAAPVTKTTSTSSSTPVSKTTSSSSSSTPVSKTVSSSSSSTPVSKTPSTSGTSNSSPAPGKTAVSGLLANYSSQLPQATPAQTPKSPEAEKKQAAIGQKFGGAPEKKCGACGKSVYKIEEVIAGPFIFHKSTCFKCAQPDCGIPLTTLNFTTDTQSGRVYCQKHRPTVESKYDPSASLVHKSAQNAPKQNVVGSSNMRTGGDLKK